MANPSDAHVGLSAGIAVIARAAIGDRCYLALSSRRVARARRTRSVKSRTIDRGAGTNAGAAGVVRSAGVAVVTGRGVGDEDTLVALASVGSAGIGIVAVGVHDASLAIRIRGACAFPVSANVCVGAGRPVVAWAAVVLMDANAAIVARVVGAGIGVVAVGVVGATLAIRNRHAVALTARASVPFGTRQTVVAHSLVERMFAHVRGAARVVRTPVAVIAISAIFANHASDNVRTAARPIRTNVVLGAWISVVALGRVGRMSTDARVGADVVRAGIGIVAVARNAARHTTHHGRAGTTPPIADVVGRARITVVAIGRARDVLAACIGNVVGLGGARWLIPIGRCRIWIRRLPGGARRRSRKYHR